MGRAGVGGAGGEGAVTGCCTCFIHSGTAFACTKLAAGIFPWPGVYWFSCIQVGRACGSINEFAEKPLAGGSPLGAGMEAVRRTAGYWPEGVGSRLSELSQLGKVF